jgi:hypothetical protein
MIDIKQRRLKREAKHLPVSFAFLFSDSNVGDTVFHISLLPIHTQQDLNQPIPVSPISLSIKGYILFSAHSKLLLSVSFVHYFLPYSLSQLTN